MMKHWHLMLAAAGALLVATSLTSCAPDRPIPEVYTKAAKPEFPEGSYERFVYTIKDYPVTMETYRNRNLLKKAGPSSQVYICLEQQRGRLYVDGQVAADWPVSTGVPGRETPPGNYRVVEKKKEYASNSYGNIYNANGKLVKYNADLAVDAIPEGGTFKGSPMPNWMRLTWDGVGMHTGKVQAGKRLSHGCIRTPGYMASQLYDITDIGTRVFVQKEVEKCYPALALQAKQAYLDEIEREKAIKADNAARLKQWETENPRAARRYAEKQAKAKAKSDAAKTPANKPS